MENTSFKDFIQKAEGKEWIVLLGAGGLPEDWVNVVAKLLKEEGISTYIHSGRAVYRKIYAKDYWWKNWFGFSSRFW